MIEKNLKFLKMIVKGHPLIMDDTELSMVASQRVYQDSHEELTNLFGSVWVNNLITIVGRNAAGKTTLMKLTMGILSLLLNNKSIEQTRLNGALIGENNITFKVFFYGTDMKVYLDEITLAPVKNSQRDWIVQSEKIFLKVVNKQTSKKSIFDFDNITPYIDRSKFDSDVALVLAKDDSIFRMILAKERYIVQPIVDTLTFTNMNMLVYDAPEVPGEILEYLDPTVDYLKIDRTETGNAIYRLKFKGIAKEITDNNFATIELYLSSGTAKGITLYQYVLHALQLGGIIFVDELENHFNHAIVRAFIEYFIDPTVNKNSATLIFSTHYSELLDDINRGDQVYFTIRNEHIEVIKFSDTPMREDISKTEVFDADNLNGTSPNYRSYMALLKATRGIIK